MAHTKSSIKTSRSWGRFSFHCKTATSTKLGRAADTQSPNSKATNPDRRKWCKVGFAGLPMCWCFSSVGPIMIWSNKSWSKITLSLTLIRPFIWIYFWTLTKNDPWNIRKNWTKWRHLSKSWRRPSLSTRSKWTSLNNFKNVKISSNKAKRNRRYLQPCS